METQQVWMNIMNIKSNRTIKTDHHQSGKTLIVLLILVAVLGGILYTQTNYLQQGLQWVQAQIDGQSQTAQVTFYQWTDENGEMQISQLKPVDTTDFISFQADPAFMGSQNQVDQSVLDKGNAYQTGQLAKQNANNATPSKRPSGAKSNVSSMYPFSAMSKTKNCVNLATQISDAKARGKDTSALKKRQAKEC